ncbi:MAG: shikimate dehydrogenase [Lachnospiraceae bacterium]|nr:shikimate dehydrogenase [Lachnospiraceae bacterium]
MEYGLIGEHLPHSFSKEIHRQIGELEGNKYAYELKELRPDEVGEFLKSADFKGINVTIPYKQTVMEYLDFIDDNARNIGAVNTIVNKGGKLYGYNTDFYGLRDLIIHTGLNLSNKKVLILGTGGTSKTAEHVCMALKAAQIIKVSRSKGPEATNCTYAEAYDLHADADVIINTTPVGMYPVTDASPADIDRFDSLQGYIDVIYNPLHTDTYLRCKKRGIRCACGLYMLVTQAVYAYGFFFDVGKDVSKTLDTDCSFDKICDIIDKIYTSVYNDKLSIVLTGMPGCGKSTVGKLLADKLHKTYVDTDELIVRKEGREITDIFASDGEEYFRDAESKVISEIALNNGYIIATGGGAILRPHNVKALAHNGVLVFIDRPLKDLIPTDDRPTASDVDMLKKRYEERYDIYTDISDIHIKVTGDAASVADKIAEMIGF